MKNMLKNKNTRTDLLTYLLVILAFVVMQGMNSAGLLGSSVKGFLIPICVYISLAVSLNLLVQYGTQGLRTETGGLYGRSTQKDNTG